MKKYALNFCMPDNLNLKASCMIESDEPFLSIHKGDFINPHILPSHWVAPLVKAVEESESLDLYEISLRVTNVEHLITQTNLGFAKHQINVFTEIADEIASARN